MFFIEMIDEGKTKQIIYEVKNVNVRNEIVSKIKYLMVLIYFKLYLLYITILENEPK